MKAFKTFLLTLALVWGGAALADNDRTPPGNPCAKGNGNPCNGNDGNGGQQGNSGGRHDPAPPISIPRPAVVDRHVYVTQIGSGNETTVRQLAPDAFAKVVQAGDGNRADVAQSGSAPSYVDLRQLGFGNDGKVTQNGNAAGNTLYAVQAGAANSLRISQTALTGENGALLTQFGVANEMTLTQSGGDNLAKLNQTGDDNAMTASQSGNGNRLLWIQLGSGLSDLSIRQTGGQSASVTQTR